MRTGNDRHPLSVSGSAGHTSEQQKLRERRYARGSSSWRLSIHPRTMSKEREDFFRKLDLGGEDVEPQEDQSICVQIWQIGLGSFWTIWSRGCPGHKRKSRNQKSRNGTVERKALAGRKKGMTLHFCHVSFPPPLSRAGSTVVNCFGSTRFENPVSGETCEPRD
jgi:hypothetical protein